MQFIDLTLDVWHRVAGDPGSALPPAPQPRLLLTMEQWRVARDHWPAGLPTGLVVPNTTDVDDLADDLRRPELVLVALEFPKWTDGRAYSQAHQLRRRHRFAGEVRATGEVLVDMLPMLQRTGFDSVVLRADQKASEAQRALGFFGGHYQADVLRTRPRFARVAA